jgi:hypothetical protein
MPNLRAMAAEARRRGRIGILLGPDGQRSCGCALVHASGLRGCVSCSRSSGLEKLQILDLT